MKTNKKRIGSDMIAQFIVSDKNKESFTGYCKALHIHESAILTSDRTVSVKWNGKFDKKGLSIGSELKNTPIKSIGHHLVNETDWGTPIYEEKFITKNSYSFNAVKLEKYYWLGNLSHPGCYNTEAKSYFTAGVNNFFIDLAEMVFREKNENYHVKEFYIWYLSICKEKQIGFMHTEFDDAHEVMSTYPKILDAINDHNENIKKKYGSMSINIPY